MLVERFGRFLGISVSPEVASVSSREVYVGQGALLCVDVHLQESQEMTLRTLLEIVVLLRGGDEYGGYTVHVHFESDGIGVQDEQRVAFSLMVELFEVCGTTFITGVNKMAPSPHEESTDIAVYIEP